MMALLNIFKRKKPAQSITLRRARQTAKLLAGKKVEKKPPAPPKSKKVSEIAYRVLKIPQVTEKATDLVKKNQYVFRVFTGANKKDIKKTIEDIYGVDVLDVKVIKVPAKQRRLGRIKGWRKAYKKAIIRIKEGQKIELLPR